MNPERYERLHQIVDEAMQLPRASREAYVASVSTTDPRLRAEALDLLAATESLDEPPAGLAPGDVVGRYRIEREIATGGMGAVYLGRRGDVDQAAAIKVIRPGAGGHESAARFTLEARILATLSHPNIAALLDVGTLDDGRPYIAMEFVDGVPITDYADRARLSVAERVRLMRLVCAGVTHAHRKLIIHRDIKPGNILVTADGVPKLLDFGIAKLLGDADGTRLTATLANPGTPLYASPEQLNGARVDTGADVYALGVVLFELLTGQWPFAPDAPRQTAAPRASGTFAEPPTANAFRRAGTTTGSLAALRGVTPPQLARQLRGDLDAIVSTALAPNLADRYGSVAEFSEDLERYLAKAPISVRAATPWYKARLFASRNPAAAVASVAALLAVIGGLVGTYTQWQRAESLRLRAERRFEGVRSLARDVIGVGGGLGSEADGTEARQALLRSSVEYLEGLEREADDDPVLLREVSQGYIRVGDAQAGGDDGTVALASYRRAVQASERAAAVRPDDPAADRDLAQSLERVGTTLSATGNVQEGQATLARSLSLYEEVLAADRSSAASQRDLAGAHIKYADAVAATDPVAARASYDAARVITEQLAERDRADTAARQHLTSALDGLRKLDHTADPSLASQEETEFYAAIEQSNDPERLQYFLTRFPDGAHAATVRARLARLRSGAPPAGPRRTAAPATDLGGELVAGTPAPTVVDTGIVWKAIPAGRFQMGCDMRPDATCRADERPRHPVTITRPFQLAATETTLDQFRSYAKTAQLPVPDQPAWNTDGRAPIVNVTWEQAQRFCAAVGGRLPTEAEWEWAALGGGETVFPWGNTFERGRANAGFPSRDGWDMASPAGTFGANGYGLFDMAGNVWEWVADWYSGSYYQQSPGTDPAGPPGGISRVLRGGAYSTALNFLRVTQRAVESADRRRTSTGVRCAR